MKPKNLRSKQEKKKQKSETSKSSAVEEPKRRADQMSTANSNGKPRHPVGKTLKEALEEDAPRLKAQKGLIDKRSTLIKVGADGAEADAGVGASMHPSPEELAQINGFTRRPVSADEVVAFPTLSCNDMDDRDDDRFSTQCVKDFAELPQPFSPTGKSFMLDHNYSVNNAVGRIFDTTTAKEKGVQWLKNKVYVPNTAKNAGFIEDLDFGINWAVSVGVTLGKSNCTVCGAPFSSWGWWCSEGHDKGAFYDPNSDLTDDWGYPIPVDPKTNKNAVKCVREFSDPIDMYELSQVFLGAQYFAALDTKAPELAAVVKSAAKNIPILGLTAKEAEIIPFRHEPQKVSEARKLYKVSEVDDGSLVWTDADGLRWTFDPENPDEGVLSLGKAAATESDEEEDNGEHQVREGASSDGEGDPNGESDAEHDGVEGEGVERDPSVEERGAQPQRLDASEVADEDDSDSDDDEDEEEDSDSEEDSDDESADDSEEVDTNNEEESEEKSVSKKQVISAAQKTKLPDSAIKAAQDAEGDGLEALLSAVSSELEARRKEIAGLTEKASLGDQFLKELRTSAIDAYVKNNQAGKDKGVDTTIFERLLDKCGDDADLIKALGDRELAEAQAKFPKSVRRSSFGSDANHVEKLADSTIGGEDSESDETSKRVKRLHS